MRSPREQNRNESSLDRLRKLPRFRGAKSGEEDKIGMYLDQLCSCLGVFSPETRADARQEVHQHLTTLIAALEERGIEPPMAVEAALRQFGDPIRIGKRMARAWSKNGQSLQSEAKIYGRVEDFLLISGLFVANRVFHADIATLCLLILSLPVLRLLRRILREPLRISPNAVERLQPDSLNQTRPSF